LCTVTAVGKLPCGGQIALFRLCWNPNGCLKSIDFQTGFVQGRARPKTEFAHPITVPNSINRPQPYIYIYMHAYRSEEFSLKGLFHPWAQWDRGLEFAGCLFMLSLSRFVSFPLSQTRFTFPSQSSLFFPKAVLLMSSRVFVSFP